MKVTHILNKTSFRKLVRGECKPLGSRVKCDVQPNVHRSTIYNSQDMEAT